MLAAVEATMSALFGGDKNLLPLLGIETIFPTFNPYRRHYAGYAIQDIVLISCNCRIWPFTIIYNSYENYFIVLKLTQYILVI